MEPLPPLDTLAWICQELAVGILGDVAKRCEAARIPFLPVKGVVTSRILYTDVSQRPIADVDIRIRPRDYEAFRKMARAVGWRCLRVARTYRNLVYGFHGLALDVEATVGPPGLCALSVDAMLSRSIPRELAPGLRVLVPELHDHAVVLTVNAFKDKISTAARPALLDLERIVVHPGFSTETFVARVLDSRIATITWLVASWMEAQRGLSTWGEIRTAIAGRTRIRRFYASLFERLVANAQHAPLGLRLVTRAGADRRIMRAEALVGAVAWEAEMWLRRQRRLA